MIVKKMIEKYIFAFHGNMYEITLSYYRCLEEKTERSIGSESIFNAQRHFLKLINYISGNDIGIGLKKLRSFNRVATTKVLSYMCFIKYQ